jgi:hypothetical protein
MSTVRCLVVEKEIGARECVAEQVERRCFCMKAVQAINEVQQIAMPKSKLEEQLETCKAMAQDMLKKLATERYAGPALRKMRGEAEPAEVPLPTRTVVETAPAKSMAQVYREGRAEAPAPRPVQVDEEEDEREAAIQAQENGHEQDEERQTWPEFHAKKEEERAAAQEDEEPMRPPAICSHENCRTALRVNNTTNLCRLHRNKVTSRKRKDLVPAVARAAGTVKNALAADPLPSREKGRRCSVSGCKRILANKTRGDKCAPCCKGIKPGGGWEPCAHAPRCPRMTQRWKDPLCALCRQRKKYHLRTNEQLRAMGVSPADAIGETASPEPKEKKMPTGTPKNPKNHCPGCGKGLRSDNTRNACTPCINGLPASLRPVAGAPVDPAVFKRKSKRKAAVRAPEAVADPAPAAPLVPPRETHFPGMPAFDQVPLGWTVGFLKYLRESSIAVEDVVRAA